MHVWFDDRVRRGTVLYDAFSRLAKPSLQINSSIEIKCDRRAFDRGQTSQIEKFVFDLIEIGNFK